MPQKTFEINVVPGVLTWARETIGLSIEDVAKKLGLIRETVEGWELGKKHPTISHLEKLAKIYQRPLAIFFLPQPPKDPPLPQDFRKFHKEKKIPLSSKTLLAIRRARRIQKISTELLEESGEKAELQKIKKIDLNENPEFVASQIREKLGVDIETQLRRWKNEYHAFKEWKNRIEQEGIFISQFSMPIEEARAFSLLDKGVPIIVINTKDSVRAKIFSLFHEFSHILLRNAGICNMEEGGYSYIAQKIEIFCNRFAGAVLVPKDSLLSHRLLKSEKYWPDEVLEEIARDFKVSKEVVLRRLLHFSMASKDFYEQKHREWELVKKTKGWGVEPAKKYIYENSIPFVNLVLSSYRGEKITVKDAADYLSIRLKYLPRIEQLISGYEI